MTTTINTIPPVVIIQNNTSVETLQDLFNECLATGNLPDNLKLVDTILVFKKKDPLHNKSYKAVSVLSGVSKIFEKLMQK